MMPAMPNPQVQILVCLNERPADAPKPCCAGRGSLEVYHRFKDRVRELGMRDGVMVTRTGCLKHCSRGITVAIWPYNLWYGGVTAADVDEILGTTVAGGGKEVERLRMPDIPWE
jgi:(2Fe-2S) ferredoxin